MTDVEPTGVETTEEVRRSVMPYCMVVKQAGLREALEISYVNPAVGGVLATGQRGTAKSTTVRAFSLMAYGVLPVTLPIGATEDRVIGGWDVEDLMKGGSSVRDGLLVQASRSEPKMLYVDEVNLLDDYLVNIILDTLSTGHLSVQRDYRAEELQSVRFSLVGTMNPDEGGLRPQLLDRFGLVVRVEPEEGVEARARIVESVLKFEEERTRRPSSYLDDRWLDDLEHRRRLEAAKDALSEVVVDPSITMLCAALAARFRVPGHRGELVLLRASRALAAIKGNAEVRPEHVRQVAQPALLHRRSGAESPTLPAWTAADEQTVDEVIAERATTVP